MPSTAYRLIREAILNEQQVTCAYKGLYREICPHIIGLDRGEEKVLAWQFGSKTSSALPPGGERRCLFLAEVRDIKVRAGRWHTGRSHRTKQRCVSEIDLDINVHVRKR